jgi:hypothetical protein
MPPILWRTDSGPITSRTAWIYVFEDSYSNVAGETGSPLQQLVCWVDVTTDYIRRAFKWAYSDLNRELPRYERGALT